MSVQRADLMGTQHIMNITYSAQETLYTAATTLATSEPATATFSYTVAAGDLPVFDGVPLGTPYYLAFTYAAGVNTSTASATICYRIKKNTTSVYTSTSVTITASQYWTLSFVGTSLQSCVVGDIYDVFLWQSTANLTGALTWNYQAFSVGLSRVQLDTEYGRLLANVNFTYTGKPAFTLGASPTAATTQGIQYYITGADATDVFKKDTGTSFKISGMKQHTTYNMYRSGLGDGQTNTVTAYSSATYQPYYFRNQAVTKIEWTPTNIIL